jgi:hypothetical protein
MSDPTQPTPPQDDSLSWLPWALGFGALAVVGGVGYVGYKGAKAVFPFALAAADPDLYGKYAEWQKASPERRREMALEAARDFGAKTKRVPQSTTPVINKWYWTPEDSWGVPSIRGQVYGKTGARDGAPITVTPVSVHNGIIQTARSRYLLGSPLQSGQDTEFEAPADSPARLSY